MSVGEDQTECPLCMEPLELDDINFFPCTCGYQICRFCWHRIRTDENGLCPACRKAYPEDPAEFKPLTEDELQRIKRERRQKEAQRKQKAAENRKHLANVRVVQKNLVFVVGLSQRLADPEVLKKHEYFGKFGKIHKVVINQSTSYAGAQVGGPSASAYVTYHRAEDALKAIQVVNNIHVDGRTLKASLGTTKYCSHFLRGSQCPKGDCMYLHELGEEAASFTKEEMQQGKHQEYEQKLYEQFMNSQNLPNTTQGLTSTTAAPLPPAPASTKSSSRKKPVSPVPSLSPGHTPPPQHTKEAWPSLQGAPSGSCPSPVGDRLTNGTALPPTHSKSDINGPNNLQTQNNSSQSRAPGFHRNSSQFIDGSKPLAPSPDLSPGSSSSGSNSPSLLGSSQYPNGRAPAPPLSLSPQHHHSAATVVPSSQQLKQVPPGSVPPSSSQMPPFSGLRGSTAPPPGLVSAAMAAAAVNRKLPFQSAADSMSLFSSTNGFPAIRNPKPLQQTLHPLHPTDDALPTPSDISDTIPVSTSTDWQAAFGFTSSAAPETHDDDLGFDPWNESAKGLAEIIEKESSTTTRNHIQGGSLKPGHHSMASRHPQGPAHHSPSSPPNPGGSPFETNMPRFITDFSEITQILDKYPKNGPPGFTPNHLGAPTNNQMGMRGSKIMGLMHFPSVPPNVRNHSSASHGDMLNSDINSVKPDALPHPQNEDPANRADWQDGLRALLPNINISFGGSQDSEDRRFDRNLMQQHKNNTNKNWSSPQRLDRSWDPAIVTSGNIADNHSEEPHWMASLQHLTEDSGFSTINNSTAPSGVPQASAPSSSSPSANNPHTHRMPMAPPVQQLPPYRNNTMPPAWPPQNLAGPPLPPPGFHNPQMRSHTQITPELQQLAEGYQ